MQSLCWCIFQHFEHCISTVLFVSPTTITPKEILKELSAQAKKIHDVCSHCPDEKAWTSIVASLVYNFAISFCVVVLCVGLGKNCGTTDNVSAFIFVRNRRKCCRCWWLAQRQRALPEVTCACLFARAKTQFILKKSDIPFRNNSLLTGVAFCQTHQLCYMHTKTSSQGVTRCHWPPLLVAHVQGPRVRSALPRMRCASTRGATKQKSFEELWWHLCVYKSICALLWNNFWRVSQFEKSDSSP